MGSGLLRVARGGCGAPCILWCVGTICFQIFTSSSLWELLFLIQFFDLWIFFGDSRLNTRLKLVTTRPQHLQVVSSVSVCSPDFSWIFGRIFGFSPDFHRFYSFQRLFLRRLSGIFPRPKHAKTPRNTPRTPDQCSASVTIRRFFKKNVFFGVNRGRIQNKARTWKRGLKCPVEFPKTQYSAKVLWLEFRTLGGVRQLWD